MKLKRLLLITTLSIILFSCKDKNSSFVQVKSIETEIYNSIKEYRETHDQTGPFVHQYLMVEEAQLWSYKMATGLVPLGTQGLDEHWARLDEKYTFYNKSGLVMKSGFHNGEQILTELLLITGADSILLSDVTQCGVGVETDPDGINFITILLAKADS
ncbi:MAG: hypothetical protein R6W31_12660 [Bacteroidales bacterium]